MIDADPAADGTAPPDGTDVPALPGAPTSSGTPGPAAAPIELVSTRRLLAVAFDLLVRANEDMRRSSFYIGAIILGTSGPLALTSLAVDVAAVERSPADMGALIDGALSVPFASLLLLSVLGIVVGAVESRTLASALLGGRMAGRPIDPRRALARSRQVFWSAVGAALIAGIPLLIAQRAVSAVVDPLLGAAVEAALVTQVVVTVIVGAPFAYVLSGVVLGDVDPVEAARRSFRVMRARPGAAALIVTFETVALLLVLLGATSGLDLAIRTMDALGLGSDSGPAGLALMTAGLVAIVFAFGTLIYTVIAITVAPQVVMFVGLTHATMGLDRVVAGGTADPYGPTPAGHRPFRVYPRPMLVGFGLGAVLLAVAVLVLLG